MTAEARTCGDCDACCLILGVKSLEKPPHQRCEHQCEKGCGIYESRPDPCRNYRCSWLDGQIGIRRDRPDRLGVIFDAMAPNPVVQARAEAGETEAIALVEKARRTVRAREVSHGAFGRERVKRWLRELHGLGVTVQLIPFAGRKLPVGRPI
ncbi:MAG TPA: hypothetical protein VEA38_16885 [Terriglobales bacterium]|nr:hypothetical protein [Terriglobales bacterium]